MMWQRHSISTNISPPSLRLQREKKNLPILCDLSFSSESEGLRAGPVSMRRVGYIVSAFLCELGIALRIATRLKVLYVSCSLYFIMCIHYVEGKRIILLCYVTQLKTTMAWVQKRLWHVTQLQKSARGWEMGSLCSLNLQTFINWGGSVFPRSLLRQLQVLDWKSFVAKDTAHRMVTSGVVLSLCCCGLRETPSVLP